MEKLHKVHLKPMSAAVLSKLRNGHRVRAALSGSGHGCSCMMKEHKIKDLMKASGKGAKTISLDAEEREANKAEGSGIMAGGRIKMKGIKKAVGKIARSGPVQAVKKAGLHDLAALAEEGLEEAGVPRPVAKASISALERKADKATGGKPTGGKLRVKHALKKAHVGRKAVNTARTVAKHPITQEVVGDLGAGAAMALFPEGGPVSGAAGKYAAQQALAKAAGGRLTTACTNAGKTLQACDGSGRRRAAPRRRSSDSTEAQPAPRRSGRVRKAPTKYDPATGKGLYAAGRSAIGAGLYAAGAGMYAAGGAIGASNDSRITNIGAGGNLLPMRNPALASQPLGANFQYSTEFPPALASEIRGSGIYA